jgi:hypothetical protein
MTARIPENVSTWLVDWRIVAIMGNTVPPLALRVPAEKDGARARASQLIPAGASWWPLVKHDGRAEAALIALYGSRLDALYGFGPQVEW